MTDGAALDVAGIAVVVRRFGDEAVVRADRAYRGLQTGTLLATSSEPLAVDVWAFLELKAAIADSGGLAEFRLDGASVLTFSGDTCNAGTAEIAKVRFSNHHITSSNRHTLRLDDVYFCDTNGGRNDDFLNDVKAVTLRPNADTAQADFTPSGCDPRR